MKITNRNVIRAILVVVFVPCLIVEFVIKFWKMLHIRRIAKESWQSCRDSFTANWSNNPPQYSFTEHQGKMVKYGDHNTTDT
jgi:hypothetical protein